MDINPFSIYHTVVESAPPFAFFGGLLKLAVYAYVAVVAVEVFKNQRKIGEAIWWPVRAGIKATVWIGKNIPALKDEMEQLRKKLEEWHTPV